MPTKKDGNHNELSNLLDSSPLIQVADTHMVGSGFGDIVVGARIDPMVLMALQDADGLVPYNFIFEIKDPAQQPCKRKLSDIQQTFHDNWPGQHDRIETISEALQVMGLMQ